jgi:glycosyltransferase involved in cell wall biosynthesis
VVCAPALWQEAFGLTVREALSAARPVVVSRIGGLQDAVTDGQEGLVLPPGDVAAWAMAIRSLAADRSLVRRMAAAARPRARGFSAMADELTKVYARISAERISIGHQRS